MDDQTLQNKFLPLISNISKKFTWDTVEEILHKVCNGQIFSLQSLNIDSTSKKGDSYLSVISKIELLINIYKNDSGDSTEIKVPLFIKSLPHSIGRRKTFRSVDFFKNEVSFYEKVMPVLNKFQTEKAVATPFNDIPRCYAALADGENDFVVLENINTLGYQPIDRQDCLDHDHSLKIIHAFAKLHALSLAFKDQHPEEYHEIIEKNLEETYFTEKLRPWYKRFHVNCTAFWMNIISTELSGTIYEKKFKNLLENDFYGQLIEIANKKGPLNVLSQGDSWIPNFLIKYGPDNKPESVKLIDFQLVRCSSPALDLSFFFYACADEKLRSLHWDDLLKEYHRIFIKFLIELGSNPDLLTFEALKADLKENAKFGVGMAMEAVPLSMMDDNEIPDLDAIEGDEARDLSTIWILHPITKPENRQRMIDVIKHAVDNGFI